MVSITIIIDCSNFIDAHVIYFDFEQNHDQSSETVRQFRDSPRRSSGPHHSPYPLAVSPSLPAQWRMTRWCLPSNACPSVNASAHHKRPAVSPNPCPLSPAWSTCPHRIRLWIVRWAFLLPTTAAAWYPNHVPPSLHLSATGLQVAGVSVTAG